MSYNPRNFSNGTSLYWFLVFPSPLRLSCERGSHHTSRFPANSDAAAAPTLITSAFTSRACPLLSRKLLPLPFPRVVPAGLEYRSQNKDRCPVIAFSTVDHIYKTDLSKKDMFQPLARSRLGVCSPPTAHLGVQTSNHPHRITVKHFQSPVFVSFQAHLQAEEKRGMNERQNG